MEQPEEQALAQSPEEPTPAFSWEASEYIFHAKPAGWYAGLWAIVAVLCAVLGLLRQWISIVVVVVMALAVVVYSRKEPRVLQYALDEHGVSIDGRPHSYNLFKSYSVQEQPGWQEIDLEPSRRFSPRLTILADADNFAHIESMLASHMPRLDRDPDWIEQLSRYLKF